MPPRALGPCPHVLSGAAWAGRRVGLLGGSFNPAHDGHREITRYALRALALDQVWWLVSPQNPLKPVTEMAPLEERLAGARAAMRHPRVLVTDLETRLGTRYTAHTLAELRCRYPRTRFVWLMGADNLSQIRRWRCWQRIFERMPVAAFGRPAYSLMALAGSAARRYLRNRVDPRSAGRLAEMRPPAWSFLRNPLHPASATAIRQSRRTNLAKHEAKPSQP
ncbi:MAG: nicotinate-nucleotide adenylyltransferase [Rhodospirillaceae bacterium]